MKRFSVARLHHCSPVIFIILWPVISVNNFSWYFFTINQTPELQNLTLKQQNPKLYNYTHIISITLSQPKNQHTVICITLNTPVYISQ